MYGFNYYPAQQTDDRICVQNEQAAASYLVAPNSFVRLWSASEPIFYEKRADQNGRPFPMEIYEYSQRKPLQGISSDRLTTEHKDGWKGLYDRIEAIERRLNERTESISDDSGIPAIQK